jgi:hypothetical protein
MIVMTEAVRHPLRAALVAQAGLWPEQRVEVGGMEPGWVTAETLFADRAALEEQLDFYNALHHGTDRKTCAAGLIIDQGQAVAVATVALFAGFGMVPDFSPSQFALRFETGESTHDGHVHQVRHTQARFLSPAFRTLRAEDARHPDARALTDRDGLVSLYRSGIETYFRPLVTRLREMTGLSRTALWRLIGDAIAGRFLEAGRHFNCLAEAKASAMAILKQPGSPLNNRQLHYFDLTVRDGENRSFSHTFRARGGCCRFYRVDSGTLCPTCVLKPAERRDAELRLAMRRHLGLPAGGNDGG